MAIGANKLNAAHQRHPQIDQDEVGPKLLGYLQRFPAI